MNLLLTSSGVSNNSIQQALVELLGKPINESKALFIPTAIYPFPGGSYMAFGAIMRDSKYPSLANLGWKSLGILELTALPSIDRKAWVADVEEADAILVWGGDPLYLSYWMQESGLGGLLPELPKEKVYVGVSAGSMVVSSTIGECYNNEPNRKQHALTREVITFQTPKGDLNSTLVTGQGVGLVEFGIIPHYNNGNHPDASVENAAIWASKLPYPVYALDDQSAIQVWDGKVEVISEGSWTLFGQR
jgi:dipeptidase E